MKAIPTLIYCGLTLLAPFAGAQNFAVLHGFQGPDGAYPLGPLVVGQGNVLYGTTNSGKNATGTVYSLAWDAQTAAYTETVIYTFSNGVGQGPSGNLLSVNGTLIGTVASGGSKGAGAVFQLTPEAPGTPWKESTIYSFQGQTDGLGPFAGLTAGPGGTFYGTTTYGGNASCATGLGCGTVFQLTPSAIAGNPWTETVIYRFQLGGDGVNPNAGVIVSSSGNLYGTTSEGGAFGSGAIYELTPPAVEGDLWTESLIYSFAAGPDGQEPLGALALSRGGNLFGTTTGGGSSGCGTVFELKAPPVAGNPWTKSIIHDFNCNDGAYPEASLLIRTNALFGTTSGGGKGQAGTVFALLTPKAVGEPWRFISLHSFNPSVDGANPVSPLISGVGNALLGTAQSGGPGNEGTVFRVVP